MKERLFDPNQLNNLKANINTPLCMLSAILAEFVEVRATNRTFSNHLTDRGGVNAGECCKDVFPEIGGAVPYNWRDLR